MFLSDTFQSPYPLEHIQAAALDLLRKPLLTAPVLSSFDAVIDYLHASLAHSPIEHFRVLYLDRKNRLIEDFAAGTGTIDHVPVYPREVMKRALLINASAMLLAHNHPSGDPTPSEADLEMTRTICEAARVLGFVVHDHIIIGHRSHHSFRAHGDM